MTSVKKVKVALLALVAALVIAIPTSAFAGTLTVKVADDARLTTGHTYDAYQIFAGDLNGTELSKITWGQDIADNGDDFLEALQKNAAFGENDQNAFAGATSAANVAKILGANAGESQFAKDFATAVDAFLGKSAIPAQAAARAFEAGTAITVDDGYYFVRDHDIPAGQTAATRFVLNIVGDGEEVSVKASVPESDKGVWEDSTKADKVPDNYQKAADFDIDQPIDYYISGTLPSTYKDYKAYYYKFTDTMYGGLEYMESEGITVALYNKDLNKKIADLDETKFSANWDATKKVLTVAIDDLKSVVTDTMFDANSDAKVVVFYKAKLTDTDGIVYGDFGNPNDVYLTFSNNPNTAQGGENDEQGKTPKSWCVVYTYKVDETKYDAADENKKLAGAKFVLVRESDGKYAKVKLDSGKTGTGKLVEWVANQTEECVLVTDELGKINVRGLDADKYYLLEIEAPATYNLPEGDAAKVPFEIDRTLPNNATITAEGSETSLNSEILKDDDDSKESTVFVKMSNSQSTTLPSTGGIGTTIFTIVGIALIVAAAAIMVVRRRNAAALQ